MMVNLLSSRLLSKTDELETELEIAWPVHRGRFLVLAGVRFPVEARHYFLHNSYLTTYLPYLPAATLHNPK
jgi:hypothetical protein